MCAKVQVHYKVQIEQRKDRKELKRSHLLVFRKVKDKL